MKKFSKLTESKRIDVYPEEMQDILYLFETFKNSYEYIDNIQVEKGWTTINNLKRMSVNSITIQSAKKMRRIFPDGIILDDKWLCAIKILISYKKLNSNHENPDVNVHDISSIDDMINRYKAIKTLSLRCQNYGSEVKISYNVGMSLDKISLIVIL